MQSSAEQLWGMLLLKVTLCRTLCALFYRKVCENRTHVLCQYEVVFHIDFSQMFCIVLCFTVKGNVCNR